jgi:hypothetical protein
MPKQQLSLTNLEANQGEGPKEHRKSTAMVPAVEVERTALGKLVQECWILKH